MRVHNLLYPSFRKTREIYYCCGPPERATRTQANATALHINSDILNHAASSVASEFSDPYASKSSSECRDHNAAGLFSSIPNLIFEICRYFLVTVTNLRFVLCPLSPIWRRMSKILTWQVGTEGTFRTQEVVLETVQSMTKIEMKRLLEAMYGVQVERVHSLNVLGKRKSEHTLMAYKKKDFKRFYVRLTTPVDLPNVPKAIDRLGKDAGAS